MRALIIVDVQKDFCPGGALPAQKGNEVVPVINRLASLFDLVVATRDWHPADHGSFASVCGKEVGELHELAGITQIMWPDHCVQETAGAEFAEGLDLGHVTKIFDKGIDPTIDSYGAFYDNDWRRSTGLDDYLKEQGVEHVYVAGLTSEYCVMYTAMDGLKLGYRVTVVTDGIRPVNLKPTDEKEALDKMRLAGIELATSQEIITQFS